MPLDLDVTDPMYLLGRLVAHLEQGNPRDRASDGPLLDTLLVYPAKGLPLLLAHFRKRLSDPSVVEMMDILPLSGLPKGPVKIEDQSCYWTGYYHQRNQDHRDRDLADRFTPDVLRRVGEALFGPDHWQAEMTRALGLTDSSRVRAWISDNPAKRRRVPAGVCRDLLVMLRDKSAMAKSIADEITRDSD